MTPAQVRDAKIEVQSVEERDVDDTLLTSGRVSLEDVRSANVYSPVSGRVVSIDAQLGAHVVKGTPLAVIFASLSGPSGRRPLRRRRPS